MKLDLTQLVLFVNSFLYSYLFHRMECGIPVQIILEYALHGMSYDKIEYNIFEILATLMVFLNWRKRLE